MNNKKDKYSIQINEFEEKIIEYFIESGNLKKINDKFSLIYAYLNTRRDLTQEDLIKLTKFSAGTISKVLNQLIDIGMLKKEQREDSRKYHYVMIQNLSQLSVQFKHVIDNYIKGLYQMIGNLEMNLDDIMYKLEQIKKIDEGKYRNALNRTKIESKIKDFQDLIDSFHIILPILEKMAKEIKKIIKKDGDNVDETQLRMDYSNLIPYVLEKIDSELNNLEMDMITQFKQYNVGLGTDPIKNSILVNFYIKKRLTQKQLQKLTSYSAGKISEILEELVENKQIEVIKPKGRGPYIYELKSLQKLLFGTFKQSTEIFTKYQGEFDNIKTEMDKFPENVKETEIYRGIQSFFKSFFEILPVYKLFQDFQE